VPYASKLSSSESASAINAKGSRIFCFLFDNHLRLTTMLLMMGKASLKFSAVRESDVGT
jgi:hypothetical protein